MLWKLKIALKQACFQCLSYEDGYHILKHDEVTQVSNINDT